MLPTIRYADRINAYWTGYFTSRPALKRYVRSMSAYYLVRLTVLLFYVDYHCYTSYILEKYNISPLVPCNNRQQGSWNSSREETKLVPILTIWPML